MSGYLLSVLGTILLCSILTVITPEGKTNSVIKGVAKLVCVLAIISPVLRFLQAGKAENDKNDQDFFFSQGIELDKSFIKYYSEMRVRQTQDALEKELNEKYRIDSEVSLVWSSQDGVEGIRIDKMIVIFVSEVGENVKKVVWEYLTKNYFSEVWIE